MSIHDFVNTFIASFIALFPVMNPIGSGFIVNGFMQDLDDSQRKIIAKKIIFNCLLIGIGTLIVGHLILIITGLSISVIQVGGGIIICKTGWDWLSDSGSKSTDNKQKTINKINIEDLEKKVFYPISFPISIGPGSISVIFTLMANSSIRENLVQTIISYLVIVLAIVAICSILYLFLSQGNRIMKKLGPSGNLIINKLVAFITFCIGIQILVAGIGKIFHLEIL